MDARGEDRPKPVRSFGGRVPIVVGVTGHRDLLEDPGAGGPPKPADAVRDHLLALLTAHPNTPVLVLNGMAEGADALVARVVRDLRARADLRDIDGAPRLGLIGVLPMPLDAYAESFDVTERGAHRLLVEKALTESDGWYLLDHPAPLATAAPDGASEAVQAERRLLRRAQYARLAAHLSESVHVLLALWDGAGKRDDTLGGTAEAVDWFLNGVPAAHAPATCDADPLRAPGGVLLLHVPVVRARGKPPPSPAFVQGEAAVRAGRAVLGRIEAFNRDAVERGEAAGAAADAARRLAKAPLPASVPAAAVLSYAETKSASGGLADEFQGRRWRAVAWVFALAFLAITFYELFAHGPEPFRRPLVLGGYLAGFLGSVAFVIATRRRRTEEKYLVYRSLSEAIRVQVAWIASGAGRAVEEHYDHLYRGDVEWVRQAARGLHAASRAAVRREGVAPSREGVEWATTQWVVEQRDYFERKTRTLHAAAARCHVGFLACTWLGFGVGLALFVALLGGAHPSRDLEGWALIAIVLLVAAGASAVAWREQMGHEASARRYEAAHGLFARAEEALRRAAGPPFDLARSVDLLRSLGREALRENTAWLLLHRDRPLEIRA